MDLPTLNKDIYNQKTSLEYPTYPLKILQFGTGAFLRGFVADYIHRANQQGYFEGQIVAVGSTGSGRVDIINQQHGLFTHFAEGFVQGETVRSSYINTALKKAYSAASEWDQVKEIAQEESLSIVISNTTEAGLSYQSDQLDGTPPTSFPGKLTALLYHRYQHFKGSPESGLIFLPCELVNDNGEVLRNLLLRHAQEHHLGTGFTDWLNRSNTFCNTLVDRIVTGTPSQEKQDSISQQLGYKDQLLTVAEPYTFWAIEGPEHIQQELRLGEVDSSILITEDIAPYRERKLRLLNGAHTISVALGYLHGLETMKDCMEDPIMHQFIENVLMKELLPSLPPEVSDAEIFAKDVIDRFSNPFLDHQLLSISMQYTTKMKMRNVPTLFRYYEKFGEVPRLMCLGFAAYLYFLKPVDQNDDRYRGYRSGEYYYINDDHAGTFWQVWAGYDPKLTLNWVREILANKTLWGQDLNQLPDFDEAICTYLQMFDNLGITATLKQSLVLSDQE